MMNRVAALGQALWGVQVHIPYFMPFEKVQNLGTCIKSLEKDLLSARLDFSSTISCFKNEYFICVLLATTKSTLSRLLGGNDEIHSDPKTCLKIHVL